MTVPLPRVLVVGLLTGGTVTLALGAGGYRYGNELVGRGASAAGFGVFAVALLVGGGRYALTGRSYRIVAVPVVIAGAVLCVHGVRLVYRRWPRSEQLVTIVAIFLLLVLPFELYPGLHVLAQEWYARRTVDILSVLGARPAVELAPGGRLVVVRLENGSFLRIVRECNGIYAGALFSAIVVGSKTTAWRKVGGVGFALVAVLLVNQFRMAFVGLALANDWFGPHLTERNTLRMTYYVAELGIGQPMVIVAIVGGFLLLDLWIPDILDFFTELLSTADLPSTGHG